MNVLERFYAMKPYVNGKRWEEVFPVEFIQNLDYHYVRAGCCLRCKKGMLHDEMFPPDRLTPRAMHAVCYLMITSQVTQHCWICNQMLDLDVIRAQERDLSNLHYRIHTGRCADYFSAVSAVALGEHTGLIMSPQQPGIPHQPPAITYDPQKTVDQIIKMVPGDGHDYVPVEQRRPLPMTNKTFDR